METAANQLGTPDLAVEAPSYDDGGSNTPPYDPAPAASTPQQDDEPRAKPVEWKDDKRAEIFSRAREKRAGETEPFSGDPNDPNALYGSEVDQSEMGELEKEAIRRRQEHLGTIAQQQPGQQPQQPARKAMNNNDPNLLASTMTVVVDGEERQVTVEEALRNYQIEEAAKRRLEQAKTILQQSHQFQRQQPTPGEDTGYSEQSEQEIQTSDESTFDQGPSYTSRSPANAKELVEKIQLGTNDEALQALDEFITSAINRSAPVDETTRVLTALEDHNAKQAVLAFAEKYPQIAQNQTLQQEATKEIYRNMAMDLIQAGYTREQLYKVAPTPQALTQLHKQARIDRVRGVRPVSDLIGAGYQGAMQNLRTLVEQSSTFYAPNQAIGTNQRLQRKESLQPQPVARRLSTGVPTPSQSRTPDQSRAAAVARIRQSRGQPV